MEVSKIRIKIGDHEFEAEGPAEQVMAQFETFKVLISTPSCAPTTAKPAICENGNETQDVIDQYKRVQLEKIIRVQGRVVSLTAIPTSTEDAALLIMLAQKETRNNETVTGQEIGDGLAQSGRPVGRVDRLLDKAMSEALILKSGLKRATRYRLTNSGHQKALAIARELIATLP